MADFDYHHEVLDLVKALWGLKDAPRAFGMRLARTLRSLSYVQGITDRQTWRKISNTGNGKLRTLITTHIDDIKGAGPDEDRKELLAALRKDYGDGTKGITY